MNDFYHIQHLNNQLTAIKSLTGEIMYLLKGTHSALLIDTCLGVGNLREVVEKETHLPLKVIITHGHVDHAMGAPLFDEVYMNHLDDDLYRLSSPLSERIGYIEANIGGDWRNADYVPPKDPAQYHALHDGDVFDLGDLHAEVYQLVGHTQGIVVVLVPELRLLITGDAANKSVFMFSEECSSISEYRDNLLEVAHKLKGRYDMCYMMHHEMEAPKTLLEDVAEVCTDIIKGNVDHVPFMFMGQHYEIAKAVNQTFDRLDGKFGNIVYRQDHVK